MTSRLNPYLNFNGNARQALEFYKDVFGGSLNVNTFADFGNTGPDGDRIMHGQLETELGTRSWRRTTTARPRTWCRRLRGQPQRRRRRRAARLLREAGRGRRGHDADGQAGLGRRVRHVHGQVRRPLAGQRQPAAPDVPRRAAEGAAFPPRSFGALRRAGVAVRKQRRRHGLACGVACEAPGWGRRRSSGSHGGDRGRGPAGPGAARGQRGGAARQPDLAGGGQGVRLGAPVQQGGPAGSATRRRRTARSWPCGSGTWARRKPCWPPATPGSSRSRTSTATRPC